jgi:hypothetical protein
VDKVQVYYSFLLVIGFIYQLINFGVILAKDPEKGFPKAVEIIITYALTVPVAGRIFGWW